jgi:hypothetical protein
MAQLTSDTRLDNTSYWLFFLNRDLLFDDISYSHRRQTLQPALVLSALAMATLMKSSQLELGAAGRARAVALRNAAQAAMEAACNARNVDYMLAEAAIVCYLS